MKLGKSIILLTICMLLTLVQTHAQTAAQKYVDQLKSSEELRNAAWGISARTLDGKVLAEYCPDLRLIPASNTKLLSTGLSLHELGADYRFHTSLAYSGSIENGVLKGDLYIIGGGDPTIGARDSVAAPLLDTFTEWEKSVRKTGITRIEGQVVGDGRYFDGAPIHSSWEFEDLGTYYGAGISALSFYENVQDFQITAGVQKGDSVSIEAVFPETPWMEFRSTAVTSEAGSPNGIYYTCSELSPVGEIRGSVGAGSRSLRLNCSNQFGALTCAYYFYRYLEASGIYATEGPADIDARGLLRNFSDDKEPCHAATMQELQVIGETASAPLKDIARKTNYDSDNFYAETLLRALAKERTGSSCYDSCAVAESAALRKLGLDPKLVRIADGSGLSRVNFISPSFFTDYLAAIRSEVFIETLPKVGIGTLASRMRTAPQSARERVRMKSGSMTGVRGFSGYILPSDPEKLGDTIVFSIIANNTLVEASRINFIMDKLITLLSEEN